MNIPIPNIRVKPAWIVGRTITGHPMIKAGKMTRADHLSWSGTGHNTVLLTGLFRGNPRYGEVEVDCDWLLETLKVNGFTDDAQSLENAMIAWSQPVNP